MLSRRAGLSATAGLSCLKCHFKKRKKSRFWHFEKRKKRILELWATVIENKPSLRNNIASHHRARNTVELLSLIL